MTTTLTCSCGTTFDVALSAHLQDDCDGGWLVGQQCPACGSHVYCALGDLDLETLEMLSALELLGDGRVALSVDLSDPEVCGDDDALYCERCGDAIDGEDGVEVNGEMVCQTCADKHDGPHICGQCAGSGEGQYDGTMCRACHGTGEAIDRDAQLDRDEQRAEDMADARRNGDW